MSEFTAVLLKPLDQQHDRDGDRIDPDGVKFDPEIDYTIFRDFSYRVPEDVVGSGKVSRGPDGTLVVKGTLVIDVDAAIQEGRFPYSLAIGVTRASSSSVDSDLMSIGFTANHVDPTQPTIKINRRDKTMNLTRLGHYHTPSGAGEQGSCRTALVVYVVEDNPTRAIVNLVVWEQDGDSTEHLGVPQDDPYKGVERGESTFHLSTECPFGK